VTGVIWAVLGVLGGFGLAAIGDMVSEEVRDRLDHLPHAILRLAARWLGPGQRAAIYDDEWMPELTYILKGDEARPVTRLYHGLRFALGILISARRIAYRLDRTIRDVGPVQRVVILERGDMGSGVRLSESDLRLTGFPGLAVGVLISVDQLVSYEVTGEDNGDWLLRRLF
jgi:hypothetical protein